LILVLAVVVVSVSGAYVWWSQAFPSFKKGISEGDAAVDLNVNGVDGSRFVLSEQRGRIVVIEFMTTWCGYCEAQAEVFKALREDFNGLTVASIDVDGNMNNSMLASWARDKEIGWFVGHSTESGLAYGVSGVPTVLVIDKEGTIRYRGYYTKIDKLFSLIQHLQG